MPVKDIRSSQETLNALPVQIIASDTDTNGAIIDSADYDGGVMFNMNVGAYTDGTYVLKVFESDDSGMSGAVEITATQSTKVIGNLTSLSVSAAVASGAVVPSIGVVNTLRFLRATITSTSTTTGASLSVEFVGKKEVSPVAGAVAP